MWHWKQCGYNSYVLRGPLGTSKWFDNYDALYRFCQARSIDARQV